MLTQTELPTAEPLVPERSASEFELTIEKIRSYESPSINQITVKLIKVGA